MLHISRHNNQNLSIIFLSRTKCESVCFDPNKFCRGHICLLQNLFVAMQNGLSLHLALFVVPVACKTGQVKTSKSKFPPKICHIDSIYGSKALETAFYFMQLLRRP